MSPILWNYVGYLAVIAELQADLKNIFEEY